MKIFLLGLVAAICLAQGAVAAIDPTARTAIDQIRKGSAHPLYGIQDLYVADDATVDDDLVVNGTLSPAALKYSVGALAVTNGQVVTPAYDQLLLTGPHSTSTVTIALSNPSAAGQALLLVNVGTNGAISVADSGNVAASGAIVMGTAGDSAELRAVSASTWVQVGESDN